MRPGLAFDKVFIFSASASAAASHATAITLHLLAHSYLCVLDRPLACCMRRDVNGLLHPTLSSCSISHPFPSISPTPLPTLPDSPLPSIRHSLLLALDVTHCHHLPHPWHPSASLVLTSHWWLPLDPLFLLSLTFFLRLQCIWHIKVHRCCPCCPCCTRCAAAANCNS
jgi:hypothetical protein